METEEKFGRLKKWDKPRYLPRVTMGDESHPGLREILLDPFVCIPRRLRRKSRP